MTTPIEGTTPRPWHTWHGDDSYAMNCAGVTSERCDHEYVDDDGHAQHTVALTLLQQPRYASCADDWDANAALIVAAVNSYDRLRAIEDAARDVVLQRAERRAGGGLVLTSRIAMDRLEGSLR